MLQIRNIHVAYGDLPVLSDISLEIGAESIVAVLGPNGAGKTTLLKAVVGLLQPTQGE